MSELLYTVTWERLAEPGVRNVCTGLTGRVAFARLMSALKASGGPIVVVSIEPERNDG